MKTIIDTISKTILGFCSLIILYSCEKIDEFDTDTVKPSNTISPSDTNNSSNNNENPTIKLNKHVNNWISSTMDVNYLWSEQIPENSDSTISPVNYFQSILYQYGSTAGDRFSYIERAESATSASKAGISAAVPKAGYDFVLLGIANSPNIYAFINYVVKGSPAEAAGLKRGNLFLRINGIQLTRNNYTSLISQTSVAHTLTLAHADEGTLIVDNTVNIGVGYFKENPILLDTTYNINGKTIAYLVYNSFAPDNEDGSMEYDRALNNVFGKFKSTGATELVLDLRFNGGGALTSAINLASMIVDKSLVNSVFTKRSYNPTLQAQTVQQYGEEYLIDRFSDRLVNSASIINHLGITKLYVLVSYRTASASELIINGLKPYMQVVLIGGNRTVGKNVGSVTITTTDKQIAWRLHPIVVRISNSVGFNDYINGFTPDIVQNEYDIENPKQLGNVNELLLAQAIAKITGQAVQKSEAIGMTVQPIASSALVLEPNKQNMYIDKNMLPEIRQ